MPPADEFDHDLTDGRPPRVGIALTADAGSRLLSTAAAKRTQD
jgi:hypothetical protein